MKRAAATILVFVIACTTSRPLLPLRELDPAMSRVYVIDDATRFPNSWVPFDLVVDGRDVAQLIGANYVVFDLTPGIHRFTLFKGSAAQEFGLPAGQEQYLHVVVETKKDGFLAPIDPSIARDEISRFERKESALR